MRHFEGDITGRVEPCQKALKCFDKSPFYGVWTGGFGETKYAVILGNEIVVKEYARNFILEVLAKQ